MKIIELKLSEDGSGEGITAISLVKHPAIEQNWIAFSEEGASGEVKPNPAFAFKTIDEEQRIVAGPAMVPDKLIYRVDNDGEEFFVFFTADTIRELSEKFLLQGKQSSMTLEHEATLNDLSVVETWLVEDSEKDKSAMYGFDLPVGSWFVKIKVLNDEVWELVKEKGVEGFSVEGVFAKELIKQSTNMTTKKKSKLDVHLSKIRALFENDEQGGGDDTTKRVKMAIITEISKWDIEVKNETFTVGEKLIGIFEDGSEYNIQDGEYVLEDGRKIQVDSDSKIVLIQEPGEFSLPKQGEQAEDDDKGEGAEQDKFGAVEATNADGASVTINFPGETLEVGAEITHTVDGEEQPVPTGEYTLADGKVLVVTEDGVAGDLREADAEDDEEMSGDGLKAEQIDALIEGLAEIISNFKTHTDKKLKGLETSISKMREEFNLPGDDNKDENPEGADTKRKIVVGLGKYVRQQKEASK